MKHLEVKESVDLDSGITVKRVYSKVYRISDSERGDSISLTQRELSEIAELSGI